MALVFDEVIGSSWNHPQAKPTINGTAGRTRDDVVSITSGGTTVIRNGRAENFYHGDANSKNALANRVIEAVGTSSSWTLNY